MVIGESLKTIATVVILPYEQLGGGRDLILNESFSDICGNYRTKINLAGKELCQKSIANGSQAKQGSVTFEFSACSTGKVEAASRGPLFFSTYLGRSKGLYSQVIVNYTC